MINYLINVVHALFDHAYRINASYTFTPVSCAGFIHRYIYIYWVEDCIYQLMFEHGGSMLPPNLARW
jgi:hypothetical protein